MKEQSWIPKDLKAEYAKWHTSEGWLQYESALICRLIERIGRVEAENAALKKPVTQREVIMASGNSQPQSPMQVASVCFNIISARSREAQPREEESK